MKKLIPVNSFFVDMNDLAQEFPGKKNICNNYFKFLKTFSKFSFRFLKFSTFFQKGWNDYQGSMRAIVRLQFAYQMNLSELHENGRIQYNNSDGELISIESFEKLTSIDHAQLANKATGGVVSEVIFNLFQSSKKNETNQCPSNFY